LPDFRLRILREGDEWVDGVGRDEAALGELFRNFRPQRANQGLGFLLVMRADGEAVELDCDGKELGARVDAVVVGDFGVVDVNGSEVTPGVRAFLLIPGPAAAL